MIRCLILNSPRPLLTPVYVRAAVAEHPPGPPKIWFQYSLPHRYHLLLYSYDRLSSRSACWSCCWSILTCSPASATGARVSSSDLCCTIQRSCRERPTTATASSASTRPSRRRIANNMPSSSYRRTRGEGKSCSGPWFVSGMGLLYPSC